MLKIFGICLITIFILVSCSSKEGLILEEETPESLLMRSQSAYDNKNYDESIQMSKIMLENFPTTDLHVDAQLLMAKSLGGKEKFEEQLDLLLRVLKENIIPEKVPLIYVQIAEFYEGAAKWNPGNITSDTTDFIKAAGYYRKAVFYPNSDDLETKSKALYRAGFMYTKANDLEKAKQAYSQVIESFPQSAYAPLASKKLLDPSDKTDLIPAPVIKAVAGQIEPGPDMGQEGQLQSTISDSLGLDLRSEQDEEPLIIDTTQAIIPD
jgi:tetratricopeptide (TPR) repeat protein